MNKQQFKQRWESDSDGGGITFDEVADCYTLWGLGQLPRTKPMGVVTYRVLKAAQVSDAEEYKPDGVP